MERSIVYSITQLENNFEIGHKARIINILCMYYRCEYLKMCSIECIYFRYFSVLN